MSQTPRELCLSKKGVECAECGTAETVVAHHINGDRTDNRIENLVPVCRSCHAEIHFGDSPTGWHREMQARLPAEGTIPAKGSKPVRVREEDHDRLQERKVGDESFGSVIKRLLDATEDSTGE